MGSEGRIRVSRVVGQDTDILTLAEAKNYLRVTVDTADDDLITSMISAAREIAENYLSRDLISKEIVQTEIESTGVIPLFRSPITSVSSVTVEGQAQTVNIGYSLRGSTDNPVVYLVDNISYDGQTPDGRFTNVVITYTTAGFTNEAIKQGVLSILQGLYEGTGAGMMYKQILAPYKIMFV